VHEKADLLRTHSPRDKDLFSSLPYFYWTKGLQKYLHEG
jgi:hypothetical protein